jgi:hypothetical protein
MTGDASNKKVKMILGGNLKEGMVIQRQHGTVAKENEAV